MIDLIVMCLARRFAMWLVWNVPLGRAASHVFGFAVGAKEMRVLPVDNQSGKHVLLRDGN